MFRGSPSEGVYGAEAVAAMVKAFDEAWRELQDTRQRNNWDERVLRERIARCIVEAASAGERDSATLKSSAVKTVVRMRNEFGNRPS